MAVKGTKRTNEEFVKEVKEAVGSEYRFLEPYVNANTKLQVIHTTCGHIYSVTPAKFLNGGRRCPACMGKRIADKATKSPEEYANQFKEKAQGEYTLLSSYTTGHKKVHIRHEVCGFEYDMEANSFLKKPRCQRCGKRERIDTNGFKKWLKDAVGDEYKLKTEYVNARTKVTMEHTICGREYQVTPDNFKKGYRCPKCRESLGERNIANYLIVNNIPFTTQVTFDDLRDKGLLSYDFQVGNYLIEYQGIQHFETNTFFVSDNLTPIQRLNVQKKHDKMKAYYAKEHGYTLLTPDYKLDTYDKMEEFLDTYLN